MREPGFKLLVWLFLAGVLLGGGCKCELVGEGIVRTELYFGLSRPDGGQVSENEWEEFVGRYIADRFMGGFTVVDGRGWWRDENGEMISERSKVVIVIHRESVQARADIEYVRKKYKELFGQESVLQVTGSAEVSY
jgi:hypothetical protein